MPPIPEIGPAIIELLHTEHLLSASAIVEKLQVSRPHLNKTSVYRALEKLMSDGQLCRHNLLDNELVYELRGHHHDHFVCTTCGKIMPTECQVHIEPTSAARFQVVHHHLTLFGLCADCQKAA